MISPVGLMKQTITLQSVTSRDSFGKPTLGAQTTAPARVQPRQRLIRDARGNESLSSHVIYTIAAITLDSRIWIPGANTSDLNQANRPITVDPEVDGTGAVSFYVVHI